MFLVHLRRVGRSVSRVAHVHVSQSVGAVHQTAGLEHAIEQCAVHRPGNRTPATDLGQVSRGDEHRSAGDEFCKALGRVGGSEHRGVRCGEIHPVEGLANDLRTGIHAREYEVPDVRRGVVIVVVHLRDKFAVGSGACRG